MSGDRDDREHRDKREGDKDKRKHRDRDERESEGHFFDDTKVEKLRKDRDRLEEIVEHGKSPIAELAKIVLNNTEVLEEINRKEGGKY